MYLLRCHNIYRACICNEERAELELDRYMNSNRILQKKLVAENCYSSNVKTRSNQAILNENLLIDAQLQAEIAYYQELSHKLVACRERTFSTTKSVVTLDHVETTPVTRPIPTTSAQTPTTTREITRDVPTVSTVVSTHDFEETTEATTQHRTEAPSSSVTVKTTKTPPRTTTTTAHQERQPVNMGPSSSLLVRTCILNNILLYPLHFLKSAMDCINIGSCI